MIRFATALLALGGAAPLVAQSSPPAAPTGFATAADTTAVIADMERGMKPGQGFAWRPLVKGGTQEAALEIWKKPGKPALHPTEAEYAIVVDGAGTLVMGGTMADATETRPGLTEGSRIDGGTTHVLHKGDVMLIPAGVPHWFGITGKRLVLLGTKIPQATQ